VAKKARDKEFAFLVTEGHSLALFKSVGKGLTQSTRSSGSGAAWLPQQGFE